MSIHERCWKCSSFNFETETCDKAQKRSWDDLTAITSIFSWGTPDRPNPHLIFDFHREIHPDNIKEIAMTMARTAANKMNCLNLCSFDKEADHDGITGLV
jgi:hypothetical protein